MQIRHKFTLEGHAGAIYGLCAGDVGKEIFSASSDGFVASWDPLTMRPLPFSVKIGIPLFSVLYLEEQGLLIAGNGKGGLHVIDRRNKKELRLLQLHTGYVFRIAYSPEHKMICSVSSDGTIAFTGVDPLENLHRERIGGYKLRDVKFNPYSDELAVGSADCSVHLFQASTQKSFKAFAAHDQSVNCCEYIGKHVLLTGGKDAMLKRWDLSGKEPVITHSVPAHNYAIYDIAMNRNTKIVLTASRDKTVKVWHPEPATPIIRIDRAMNGHVNSVNRVIWISDQLFASAGDDKTIRLWEIS